MSPFTIKFLLYCDKLESDGVLLYVCAIWKPAFSQGMLNIYILRISAYACIFNSACTATCIQFVFLCVSDTGFEGTMVTTNGVIQYTS